MPTRLDVALELIAAYEALPTQVAYYADSPEAASVIPDRYRRHLRTLLTAWEALAEDARLQVDPDGLLDSPAPDPAAVWLAEGIDRGWISLPLCEVHDTAATPDELEDAACVYVSRLLTLSPYPDDRPVEEPDE
jgi:hypothetical protein